jgi:hypothetical protein
MKIPLLKWTASIQVATWDLHCSRGGSKACKGGNRKNEANVVPNRIGVDWKPEDTITKSHNIEIRRRATNGGLKKQTNRGRAKVELTTTKRHPGKSFEKRNQEKKRGAQKSAKPDVEWPNQELKSRPESSLRGRARGGSGVGASGESHRSLGSTAGLSIDT